MAFLQVGDVKSRIKRQFGDESGVQIMDSDIYNWISDALRHIHLNNEELVQAIATIDLVSGTQEYDLPADVISISGVTIKTSDSTGYFTMNGYQLEQFNTYVDGWDGNFFGAGVAAIYTVYDSKIKLFPTPDTSSLAGLKLYYSTYLDEITSDIAIDVPKIYFNIIVNYCLQKAYEMDEDWIAAEVKMQEVQQGLHIARGKTNPQQETYKTITVLDEDRW